MEGFVAASFDEVLALSLSSVVNANEETVVDEIVTLEELGMVSAAHAVAAALRTMVSSRIWSMNFSRKGPRFIWLVKLRSFRTLA